MIMQSVSRVAVGLLLTIATAMLAISPKVDAGEAHELISPEAAERIARSVSKDVNGLLAFRFIDDEADTLISAAEVYYVTRHGKKGSRPAPWQINWVGPASHSVYVASNGFRPFRIDSVRVPADSLVVVVVSLQRGNDTIPTDEARQCCVEVLYDDLDELVPRNSIVGSVFDDNLESPVPGAGVYCEETRIYTTTDSLGKFNLLLDTLKKVVLHVWHPLYDSVRFDVGKNYIRTEKPVEVHFERLRDPSVRASLRFSDSTTLLIVGWQQWSSWGRRRPNVFAYRVYTYALKSGDLFGPTSSWITSEYLPFRLIRTFKDREAWVQFGRGLRSTSENWRSPSNFFRVSDSVSKLITNSSDGGYAFSMQLQPDYAPRGTIIEKWQEGLGPTPIRRQPASYDSDSCDMIRAEVERVHIKNLFYLLEGEFSNSVAAFSADFVGWPDRIEISEEFFEQVYESEKQSRTSSYRMAELFDLRRAEVYIHGQCDPPANEKFVRAMSRTKLEPQVGDVFVHFPEARMSAWHGGWSAVYRLEGNQWKIIAGG